MSNAQLLLRVADLTKLYRTRDAALVAFEHISFEVRQGEIVCLLGPSGCGKSSLLATIAGLQSADAGEVLLNGNPLREPHPDVAVVFQDPCLLPWRNVWSNVALGLQLRHEQLPSAVLRRRVQSVLCAVGLEAFARHYPHQLSGGMAQRVALARALVRNPALLLLDEPFAALDAHTRHYLQCTLLQLVHGQNTTCLLVTHDIDEALFLADRVLLMSASPGRIEQQWHIPVPHPRQYRDPQMIHLHATVLEHLAKHSTIREEAKEVADWVI